MNDDVARRVQWLWSILFALIVVFLMSTWMGGIANAGWLYDVNGVMAPTLDNPVSASFTGELEFPGDLSTEGTLRISLTNEVDPVTQEPIVRETSFEMVGNTISPIGLRQFWGVWDNEPFAMSWYDWESVAGLQFSAADMEGGGGWDAIGIGFHDYQLGSLTEISNRRETPQVNEPGGLLLAALGMVCGAGMLRKKSVQ